MIYDNLSRVTVNGKETHPSLLPFVLYGVVDPMDEGVCYTCLECPYTNSDGYCLLDLHEIEDMEEVHEGGCRMFYEYWRDKRQ